MTQRQQPHMLDDYGYPARPDTRRTWRNRAVHGSRRALLAIVSVFMSIAGAGFWLARIGRRYAPLRPGSFQPRRILVIRLDLIGDLVLSLTVVRLLKRTYPDAEIDLLALPSSAQIAAHDPDLNAIITYDPNIWRRPAALLQPRNWRGAYALLRRLRAPRYDLAVSVFGAWAAILAALSAAPRRVGFGKEGYPGLMTDSVAGRHWDPRDHKHEVDYCLELARAAGASPGPADRVPRLFVAPQARQEIEQLLDKEALRPGRPLITCHVSSNNGQSKRWPVPYWAKLIDRLIQEDGANVVLTGAPSDLPLIESVLRRAHSAPINMAGKTSLPQLAALLQRADLLISGDSGPMHIAAAVGTPLIAIHGPTDPALSGPVSPQATVLRSAIWCSPCYQAKGPADCRFYTTQCMKNITPDQVYATIQEKLKERPPLATRQKARE